MPSTTFRRRGEAEFWSCSEAEAGDGDECVQDMSEMHDHHSPPGEQEKTGAKDKEKEEVTIRYGL